MEKKSAVNACVKKMHEGQTEDGNIYHTVLHVIIHAHQADIFTAYLTKDEQQSRADAWMGQYYSKTCPYCFMGLSPECGGTAGKEEECVCGGNLGRRLLSFSTDLLEYF